MRPRRSIRLKLLLTVTAVACCSDVLTTRLRSKNDRSFKKLRPSVDFMARSFWELRGAIHFGPRIVLVNAEVMMRLVGNYAELSMQKFSSNVVEKCLKLADQQLEEHRNVVVP